MLVVSDYERISLIVFHYDSLNVSGLPSEIIRESIFIDPMTNEVKNHVG